MECKNVLPQQCDETNMANRSKCLFLIIFMSFGISEINSAYLRIYTGQSISIYEEFDLDAPQNISTSPGYDPTRYTVIYTFGFQGKANGRSIKTVIETYMRLGGYNLILLNWEKEANTPLGKLGYGIVSKNAKKIGTKLGEVLGSLISDGLDINKLHLIGFSLGAHLFGYTGRELQSNNLLLPRITGLDPAGPLYDQYLAKSLSSDSAGFVYVIHTNPGGLGTDKSRGTVDVWFNCENKIQPGCEDEDDRDLCSHDLSWKYYCESIENTDSFEAVSADSCSSYLNSNCNEDVIYVGRNNTLGHYGNFYLSTNSESPYSKGSNVCSNKE